MVVLLLTQISYDSDWQLKVLLEPISVIKIPVPIGFSEEFDKLFDKFMMGLYETTDLPNVTWQVEHASSFRAAGPWAA